MNDLDLKEQYYQKKLEILQLKQIYNNLVNGNKAYIKSIPTKQRHPFHLIDPSPWPILGSVSAFTVALGLATNMHNIMYAEYLLLVGVWGVIMVMWNWWGDVIKEAVWKGHHTKKVQVGLRMGVALFIVSEAMFFFGFFWAFLAAALEPKIQIGAIWPPVGLTPLYWKTVPLLNTALLLYSALTVTITHYAVSLNYREVAFISLVETLIAAFLFTILQFIEYREAPFSMSDSVYGSTFFLLTGFHGFHVIVGSIFLTVCLWRIYTGTFTPTHHTGLEAAIWYWHFVDGIWIAVFGIVYIWGGWMPDPID